MSPTITSVTELPWPAMIEMLVASTSAPALENEMATRETSAPASIREPSPTKASTPGVGSEPPSGCHISTTAELVFRARALKLTSLPPEPPAKASINPSPAGTPRRARAPPAPIRRCVPAGSEVRSISSLCTPLLGTRSTPSTPIRWVPATPEASSESALPPGVLLRLKVFASM